MDGVFDFNYDTIGLQCKYIYILRVHMYVSVDRDNQSTAFWFGDYMVESWWPLLIHMVSVSCA